MHSPVRTAGLIACGLKVENGMTEVREQELDILKQRREAPQ